MKRTTLVLEDGCIRAVKALAQREQRHMSELVNELLVEGLSRRKKQIIQQMGLRSFRMGKPTVNLGDRNAIEALMES